jgi:hypothetical protein
VGKAAALLFRFMKGFREKAMINMRWMFRFLVVSVVLLSGCSWFAKPPSLPKGYSIPIDEPPSSYLSRRVILVGDNQLHNLYNEPVTLFRTGLADKIVQSAIRPVQLDFYGQDFLKWLLENTRGEPIVHLGDACDFSCTGEFERFSDIMQRAKGGWVMAPGNHDGFFYGNDHRDVEKGDWPVACRNAGEPMTKDCFVRLYLGALVLQGGSEYQELARNLGLEHLAHGNLKQATAAIVSKKLMQGNWRHKAGGRPFLHSLSWKIDEGDPWRSFVVQEVDFSLGESTSVRAILLDTAQYEEKPILVPLSRNAGVTGEILGDQLDIVKSWILSDQNRERIWVLIGHHPFDSLNLKSQKALDDLRKRTGALVYVSAHTHAGQFLVHNGDQEKDKWLELNVGSILDWSLEFRTLQIERAKEDGRLVLRSPRYTMHERLHKFMQLPMNDELWEAKPGNRDYYLGHENLKDLDAHKTETRLKDALLATFHRLIRFNPTKAGDQDTPWPSCCRNDEAVLAEIDRVVNDALLDKKIEFLLELDRFERGRRVGDEDMHQKYRLSQAIWASKYDSVHTRKPLEDNWFVVFPLENKKKE